MELILSFVIGAVITVLLGMVFSLKTKGIVRLLINVAAGITALLILSLFKVKPFTLSPLSAFLAGIMGLPGLAVIYIIGVFL